MIPAAPKWNHSPEELARLARGEDPTGNPSLLDRIANKAFGAPIASAYPKGLLTAEDYAQARKQGLLGVATGLLSASGRQVGPAPTMAQALGAGLQGGQGAYQGALDRASDQQMQGLQLGAMQQKQEQAQAQARARQEIFNRFPPPEGDDPAEQVAWMQKVLPWFAQAGDQQTVATFTEYLKSVGAREKKEHNLLRDDLGDRVAWRNPQTGEIVVEERKGQAPRDPNVGNEMRDQRTFQREQALYSDWQADTKKASNAAFVIHDTLRDRDRATSGDIAAQVRVLYGFINSMDDSVVREGEMRMVQSAAPLIGQAERLVNQMRVDGKAQAVPSALLHQMIGVMDRRLDGNKSYLNQQRDKYQRLATRWGVDPDRFQYVDPSDGAPRADAPAAPTAPAVSSGDRIRALGGR